MVAFAKQFDSLGNWTNFKQDTDADNDWELDQNRAHNKANEIAAIAGSSDHIAHDAAGNMVVAPKPENWASHYHFIYDPWDRLVEVQTADQTKMVRAYEYDGLDRMISKWSYDEDAFSLSEWRHYYYSDKWQFLEERVADSYTGSYSGSGIPAMSGWGLSGSGVAGTFRLDRQFVWGLRYVNDLVLRDRDTDTNGTLDERIYALQDPNWNVVAIANTSGVILKRFCYSAYGAPKYFTSDFSDSTAGYDWETLYCGYRYDYHTDSDVKWHIAGYRILLSHLGRWNRRDPIGYKGGINLYRYCGNNPVIYADPTGLECCGEKWYDPEIEYCVNGEIQHKCELWTVWVEAVVVDFSIEPVVVNLPIEPVVIDLPIEPVVIDDPNFVKYPDPPPGCKYVPKNPPRCHPVDLNTTCASCNADPAYGLQACMDCCQDLFTAQAYKQCVEQCAKQEYEKK